MKGTKTNTNQRPRQWRTSLRNLLSRKGSTSSKSRQKRLGATSSSQECTQLNNNNNNNNNIPQIPASVWIANIFPFLDRWSQNRLRAAHREIFLARHLLQQQMEWPADGKITVTMKQQPLQRTILSLQFSSSENCQHLVGTMSRSKKVLIYDKWSGPQHPLEGHTGHVVAARYSPDGSMLATAGNSDGKIRLWSTNNNNNKANTLDSSSSKETSIDDSNYNCNNSNNNDAPYKCFRVLNSYQNQVRYLIWSPDAQWIAAWGDEGFIRAIRIEDGHLVSTFWKTRLEVPNCLETVSFCPTTTRPTQGGRAVAGQSNTHPLVFAYNNDVVRLWNFETDTFRVLPGSSDPTRSYDGTYITSLAYSPNSTYLAVGCHVATIKLWLVTSASSDNTNTDNGGDNNIGQANNNNDNEDFSHYFHFWKKIYVGPAWSAVALLQFTPDSQYIACTGLGSQIRLVQVSTGMVVGLFNSTSRVETLCFSSKNAHTLASGGRDRTIRLWDTRKYIKETPAFA